MRLLIFICLIAFGTAQAQSLYMPRNVKKAYQKDTRSMDGKPGSKYWQNSARYAITVTATPPSRTIQGTEEIIYVNNSPDTLATLVFKLILNSHKSGAIRQAPASPDYLTTGIHIDRYTENGSAKPWRDAGVATSKQVVLNKPLMPHDSVKLSFEWHYDLSVESGREGMLDSTTLFLAYFYPRVAVYDDYYGWDRTTFTEAQEFYNDFNDYTLTVNVPKDYIVWSTGDLQNPTDVLQPTYAKRLSESLQTDSLIHVATLADLRAKQVTTQQPVNSWTWKASNVSDMAVCISNHYVWDASSVVVDKKTNRRASVQAAFLDNANDFHQMVGFGRHSLDWFSNNLPGIPYPYAKTTIVQGFADMEYPMMVNDGTTTDLNFSRFVAEHEIAHTWFPFYMGINETRYGFMDEGWTTAFEYLISQADLGTAQATKNFQQFRVNGWINDPSAEQDLPIVTPANILSGAAMGNNEYGKAALGYLALKELLGETGFKKSLHEFINRWHGKHPNPWDMFYSFNSASGKDLNWFWNNWFFSNNYIDLAIQKVEASPTQCTITIQNIGGYAAPVDVVLNFTDGTTETVHQTPVIWQANQKVAVVKIPVKKKVQSLTLAGGIFMDADERNNSWKAK
ncbi:M1 family metallopeptidase [Spirosoma sp. KCTC 42546]|uniref:M1 family metallopeptidase n=1 Tax=Spirosoma sp. KCTC 42546 TaxID=2520506 RepID=UPI00115A7FB6|nr:M1 family metallopeptidase [Spirosoma sp. KCTC 42546]QDK78379.1 M1 family metallopeptidase [Spirosoma sp. KCTC 42546]